MTDVTGTVAVAGFGLLVYTLIIYVIAYFHGEARGRAEEFLYNLQEGARKQQRIARDDPDWWKKD